MEEKIKIKRIPVYDMLVYNPHGECIGNLQNLLEILYFQLQIAKHELQGYYILFAKKDQIIKSLVDSKGFLSPSPDYVTDLEMMAFEALYNGPSHPGYEEVLKKFENAIAVEVE